MRRKILLVVLLFFVAGYSQATDNLFKEGKISGRVMDSVTKNPVGYATISLFVEGNVKPITGTVCTEGGNFTLKAIKAGEYKIVVQFIGYKPYTLDHIIIDKDHSGIELKDIALSPLPGTLQEVTVTSRKPLIENRIDKLIFNADRDLTSQGGVATDILKKVPQVSVDIDGNVELAGSTSIQFLINGKPSTIFGSNISDVLQAIPASQIKSIEVITNPGAKYDAEGLGGIINIILKENRAKGMNGNISLSGGTRTESGSLNLNARKNDFGVHAFISGDTRLSTATQSNSDRVSFDTAAMTKILLHQDANAAFTRHGFQTGIGFDWTYKKRNDFSGSLNYNNFGYAGNGSVNQLLSTTDQGGAGSILSEIASVNNTNNRFLFHNVDASIDYKRTFVREDQELDFSINTSYGNNQNNASNNQYLLPQDSLYYGTNNLNPGKEHETQIQLDYTQPIKKNILLGVGGKISLNEINSNSNVSTFRTDVKNYLFDSSLSNYLTYNQKVYAAYAEISFPVGKLFDTKIGGRYERTNISSFFSNAQQQANSPGYNTFVPSIYFLKKLAGNQTIKLSFSKRIERPDYRDLNPFVNTSDPNNISAGNPFLQPEVGFRYELSYGQDIKNVGSFMITAFYRTSNHDIQPYIVFYPTLYVGDSVYQNVSVSTRENVGLEQNLGLSFFSSLDLNSKLNVRTNLFFFQRHTINALDPGFNANSFNYRLNMNLSYQFPHNFAAEFFGNFRSPWHSVQGDYPSFTTYSLAFRKQFWNKKGSLALTAENPFNQNINQHTTLYGPNFTVSGLRRIPFRSFGLNFTWKFGKLEFKKDKPGNLDDQSGPPDTNG